MSFGRSTRSAARHNATDWQSQLADNIALSRRITAEVILSDLELALTFLDTAATSRNPATAARCHRHALDCYLVTRRCLPRMRTTPELRGKLAASLAILEQRLRPYYSWEELER
jgi:hypothetical protein